MLRTSMRLAAAVLAAGLAVAACGADQMGAAAIVGGQRISTTSLAGQVANLTAGYQRYGHRVQLQYAKSQMPQQVLSWMVRFRVRDELAVREGITVTPADVQHALAMITAQVRQSGGASLPALAVANGLPPDMLTDLGRYQAIETRLVAKLDGGTLPARSAAQQALQKRLAHSECLASKALQIRISPQFGTLDYSQLAVVPRPATLSATQPARPAVASPSPTASPQTTPAC